MSVKRILLYTGIVFVVACVLVFIFVYIKNVKMSEGTISYNMYYINKNSHKLSIEAKTVNLVDSDKIMFTTVVDAFKSGPKTPNTNLYMPKEFLIKDYGFENKTAHINLADSLYSLGAEGRILSVGALVYTLTDLSFIDGVDISVEGKPYMKDERGKEIIFTRTNVRNDPEITPEKTNWQTVTLYFADRTGERLVAEQRRVEVKQSLTLEYQIVEQLIEGPGKNMLSRTIPTSTRVKDIKTEEGICYVNLSKSFIGHNVKSVDATIYSIVNSLTELEYVNKVQFLIDGEKVDKFGNVDFNKTFERNDAIIK
ncbi:MAG: GerMN domain-containing protein [Firmicutes bacterium]|nr:GerMN domain-containing protein [Bacillota bacterium]